jgi:GTP-binding protein
VYGRGLLHLTVLIETMRREGFELMVGPPRVLTEVGDDGTELEPFEHVDIEVPEEYAGACIDLLSTRKGTMLDMGTPTAEGMQTILYEVPTRGLVGARSRLLTATRGLAVMTSTFAGYKPSVGAIGERERGNLLSHEQGVSSTYGLQKAQTRGVLFAKPNDPVYEDQIVGIHSSPRDERVNVCRTKALTNHRTVIKDEKNLLDAPKTMSLEECVEYVADGEFVEVTPDAIRMGMHPTTKAARRNK